jgi:hypothetical protein
VPVTPARGRQLSLFGVEARPPAPLDLEGLLAGAGQVGRMGGTGRVSIVLDDAWRCGVLRAELELRGLVVTCEPTGEDDRWRLRTAYSAALAPLAARWLDGEGAKVSPRDLALEGRRLRLWVAAAGDYDGQRAYLLRLAPRPRPAAVDPDLLGTADASDEAPMFTEPAREVDRLVERPPARQPPAERPNVRRRKSESKITAFDPGPDELADAEDFFADDAADEWPDSGVGDLPTVELDPVSPPVEDVGVAQGGTDGTEWSEEGIDRQIADNWIAIGDALVGVGLPAMLVGAESGGPAYRIVGPRRITRLAELVGEPPPGAPVEAWPR